MRPETILGALAFVGGAACLAVRDTPVVSVELWQAITYSGVAFLGVGLARDLWRIMRRTPGEARPKRAGEPLICFESLAGGLLVVVGLLALAGDVRRTFQPQAAALAAYAGVLLVLSGLTRNTVIACRCEKDHASVIPW